jgi:hypothetical protein
MAASRAVRRSIGGRLPAGRDDAIDVRRVAGWLISRERTISMVNAGGRSLVWETGLEPQGRFVVAQTSGVMQVEDLLRLVDHLIGEGRRHGLVRILIDLRHAELGMSKSDIYACRSLIETRDVRRDMRTALIVSPGTTRMDDYQFYETVAANNGWAVRLFTDVEMASAWLSDECSQPSDSG